MPPQPFSKKLKLPRQFYSCTLVGMWHFRIWTQRVSFEIWNLSDMWLEWCLIKRRKDKIDGKQKDENAKSRLDKETKRQKESLILWCHESVALLLCFCKQLVWLHIFITCPSSFGKSIGVKYEDDDKVRRRLGEVVIRKWLVGGGRTSSQLFFSQTHNSCFLPDVLRKIDIFRKYKNLKKKLKVAFTFSFSFPNLLQQLSATFFLQRFHFIRSIDENLL